MFPFHFISSVNTQCLLPPLGFLPPSVLCTSPLHCSFPPSLHVRSLSALSSSVLVVEWFGFFFFQSKINQNIYNDFRQLKKTTTKIVTHQANPVITSSVSDVSMQLYVKPEHSTQRLTPACQVKTVISTHPKSHICGIIST